MRIPCDNHSVLASQWEGTLRGHMKTTPTTVVEHYSLHFSGPLLGYIVVEIRRNEVH